MPAIFFANLWMLAGLVALSVPIIIHLLLRRKKKRFRFSTVQFFLKQDEQSSQRRKLRNWLLLAMRLLICTLLVLAFARPYLRDAGAAGGGRSRRQALILLDRSLSMQANALDGPKWVRAQESARQILSNLGADDRAALVVCGPGADTLSAWAPPAVVNKLLSDLRPTCGSGDLEEGLQLARKLLTNGRPDAATTLYVISDFQRSGCQDLASCPLPRQLEVKPIMVGDLVTPNLAIMDLQIEPNQDAPPHAVLASFSDENASGLKLECKLDGQLVFSRTVSMSAGGFTNVDLTIPPLKPGWHDVQLQLVSNDSLALDNTRFQTIYVPEPRRVFVVETQPTAREFEQDTFFITTALDPAKGSTNAVASRFAFEKMSADDLAAKLASTQDRLPCDLVVVPGLKRIPSALGQALSGYVRAGGGALFLLGQDVSAIHYNSELRGLLPAALGSIETCPDPEAGWRIGRYDTNLAIFAAFQRPNTGDLSLPRFLNRFSVTSVNPTQVAAEFEDGTPLVLASAAGRGRVVLVNTSADTGWSDWPKHKTFVPWLHGTALYLADATTTESKFRPVSYIAGTEADFDLGSGAARLSCQVHQPDGANSTALADEHGQVREVGLPKPGVYSLRDTAGREIRRVAVNVPPQESNLAAWSAAEFAQQLPRVPDDRPKTLAAGLFGSDSNHRELWRVLLLAVLGLLLAELFVANRTLA